jgi:hypothetical protein
MDASRRPLAHISVTDTVRLRAQGIAGDNKKKSQNVFHSQDIVIFLQK